VSNNKEADPAMSTAEIRAVLKKVAQDLSDDTARRERRMEDILHGDIPTFMELPLAMKPEQLIGADAAVLGFGYEGITAKSPWLSAPPTVSRPKPGSVYWRMGADHAPDEIRKYSLYYSIGHNQGWFPEIDHELRIHDNFTIMDYGNVSVVPADNAETIRRAREKVDDIVDAGALPIVIGGDHTIPIPTIRAVTSNRKKPIGIISFDSHLDLSFTEECWASNQWFKAFETGKVNPKNLAIIGIRSNRSTYYESKVAEALNIRYFTIDEVKNRGIDDVTQEALEIAGKGTDGIYMSLDIDVMEPGLVPSQKAPEFWGLTTDEIMRSFQTLTREKLVGFDICEYTPDYDVNGMGAQFCARMIVEVLGGQAVRKSKEVSK
jgi:arginase family enzyme